MHKEQRVDEMAFEVLSRQAAARARRTGESFEEALKAVRETGAGRQPGEAHDGPHHDQRAERWQEDPAWKLAEEQADARSRAQQEERRRTRQEEIRRAGIAAWKSFMQTEQRELELRKDGQLSRLLGEAMSGESPAALQKLASADQRQAEQSLVTLMKDGKVFYKHLEELSEGDMPARRAAERLRTTWLKERRDGWLARGSN